MGMRCQGKVEEGARFWTYEILFLLRSRSRTWRRFKCSRTPAAKSAEQIIGAKALLRAARV
jgi:hypothetical protein